MIILKNRTATIIKIVALVLLICCVFSTNVTMVHALTYQDVDIDETGSISITIKYDDNPVAGGTVTLYQVANMQLDEKGDLQFVLTQDYESFNGDLTTLDESLTNSLKTYTEYNELVGLTQNINDSGYTCFSDLKLGLYLLIQGDAADGYMPINAFLVTVPEETNGTVVYDVDASPKTSVVKIEDSTPTIEQETTTVTETTQETTTPSDTSSRMKKDTPTPTIPQTGLLVWPVVLLIIVGVLLVGLGFMLVFLDKEKGNK